MRNPYTVLGVAKTADEKQIKSAFRKLAMRYHPDHNKGDAGAPAKFAELNQAYEILSDKDKRAAFDRGEIDAEGKPKFQGGFGQSGFGTGGRGHNPFGNFDFGGASQSGGFGGNIHIDESILGDIFGQAGFGRAGNFGGGQAGFGARRSRQPRGADISAALDLSLEQIVGAEKVDVAFSDGKRLKIKLPLYLEDGQTIRLKGQGQQPPGSIAGDALVTIRFQPDPRFRLEGRTVHMDLPIGLKTAVLGGKETIKTLDGSVAVGIPAWSGSDRVLRLKDKGLPLKEGGRAPLYVHIRLMLPEEHDKNLEELVKKY
ncbi:MAG: J domain-containing protein [Candidatus Tokpelaia sp.]|uniref:DnaJ C-terminal domain-containing protein n=1 Tax=Candidatus Tokpelaia sp. TaxID=2233777 RepID=UPI00123A1600|nr:DnaJ C-terminal domain-containing protein [Candidatus Tokpelaia sp.]KAA6204451.1 MAG: J domain-containing protein [Candidatus Tokpelaia sp.]KAA6205394.1 MAG: J domain-containing protein [Candidatus Tokpelaia sp.]KAA6406143.1 J domain-containing protein [Candidatus Tokpelaia sp.]